MKESNIAQQKSKEKGNLDNEISKNQTDAINSKPKKMLSQFEISQLSFKNEKLSEEVKSLKAQIVNLNDKINEQLVTITNNKLLYDKESNSVKDKYTKEIKSLKEKLEKSNAQVKILENKHKIKIYEIENEKKLLEMKIKNLESKIDELNTKITQINREYESQILIINDSKKRTISDYEKQIEELKKNFENMQSNNIEIESKLKTQEQLVEFAKMDQEDIKFRLENELKELNIKYDELLKKSESEKKKSKTQIEMKENIIQKLFNQQKEIENESENKIKEREEKISQKANEFEKLYFQEKQEKEFLGEKNKDLLEQIEILKYNQNQILAALDMKNINGEFTIGNSEVLNNILQKNSLDSKIENIQNLFNKEKENIENDFKKEKEYYLKEQANKVESISQLKEINKKLDRDNEAARKTIDDLTTKLKEYKKNLDLTQEIRSNFDKELEKRIKDKIQEYEEQLNKKVRR